MSLILDELRREIQKLKMKLSEQVEENIRLKGFKQLVMERPQDFDVDKSFENDTRETDERGDLDLSKHIEELKARVKSLTEINESHQKLNGDLRRDNKILADDNAILTDRLREAGM